MTRITLEFGRNTKAMLYYVFVKQSKTNNAIVLHHDNDRSQALQDRLKTI